MKDLNTEIRQGREMDDTTFYTLANLVKRQLEEKRAWRFLLAEDTTNTSSASDTFLTSHTLPARFISFPNRDMLKLVSTSDTTDYLKDWSETKMEKKYEMQNENGRFYIDLNNSLYYLTGKLSKSYRHHLFYIKSAPDISATVGWAGCPDDYAKIIPFAVAVIDETGMDYDDVNARQATGNARTAQMIESAMVKWDDKLIRSTLQV